MLALWEEQHPNHPASCSKLHFNFSFVLYTSQTWLFCIKCPIENCIPQRCQVFPCAGGQKHRGQETTPSPISLCALDVAFRIIWQHMAADNIWWHYETFEFLDAFSVTSTQYVILTFSVMSVALLLNGSHMLAWVLLILSSFRPLAVVSFLQLV